MSSTLALLLDEAQRREVVDEAAVEGGLGVEVELLERLAGGKLAKRSRPSRRRCSVACDLGGEQVVRGTACSEGLSRSAASSAGGELLGGGGEAQVGEVRAQLLVERVGSSATRPPRARRSGSSVDHRRRLGGRAPRRRASSASAVPAPGGRLALRAAGVAGGERGEHGLLEQRRRARRCGSSARRRPARGGASRPARRRPRRSAGPARRRRACTVTRAPGLAGRDAVAVALEGDQRRARRPALDRELGRVGAARQRPQRLAGAELADRRAGRGGAGRRPRRTSDPASACASASVVTGALRHQEPGQVLDRGLDDALALRAAAAGRPRSRRRSAWPACAASTRQPVGARRSRSWPSGRCARPAACRPARRARGASRRPGGRRSSARRTRRGSGPSATARRPARTPARPTASRAAPASPTGSPRPAGCSISTVSALPRRCWQTRHTGRSSSRRSSRTSVG